MHRTIIPGRSYKHVRNVPDVARYRTINRSEECTCHASHCINALTSSKELLIGLKLVIDIDDIDLIIVKKFEKRDARFESRCCL